MEINSRSTVCLLLFSYLEGPKYKTEKEQGIDLREHLQEIMSLPLYTEVSRKFLNSGIN